MTKFQKLLPIGVLTLIGLLVVGYVAPAHLKSQKNTQIQGTVSLYPIGSGCNDIAMCSRAAADQEVQVLDISGNKIASQNADGKGHYDFHLAAGDYKLVAPPGRYGRGSQMSELIHLSENSRVTHDIVIDTGLR